MSNARFPQRVTVAEVIPVDRYDLIVAATTSDQTQHKVLEVQVGGTSWRVRRYYFAEVPDNPWSTICEGTVEDCVAAYNRLS